MLEFLQRAWSLKIVIKGIAWSDNESRLMGYKMLSQTNVIMHDCMGRQEHFIWKYNDLLQILYRQGTEHYSIESSCSDLNNSVVVGNVSVNTKNENQWLKTCTCTMCASTHGPSTSTEQSSKSILLPSTWNLYLSTSTSTKYLTLELDEANYHFYDEIKIIKL